MINRPVIILDPPVTLAQALASRTRVTVLAFAIAWTAFAAAATIATMRLAEIEHSLAMEEATAQPSHRPMAAGRPAPRPEPSEATGVRT